MGSVVSPNALGPAPLMRSKSRRVARSFKKGLGSGKRTPSPSENNYSRGAEPRLEGGGCQKGPQWRRTNSKSQEVLPSQASVRNPGAQAHEGRKGAGPRRSNARVPARSWAANAALASAAASAVSWLLSGWGAGINLSPPHSVQSQALSHAGAGRAERGGAEGAARAPVGFSKQRCAVAAGRARAADEPGAAQSPQAPAGGVEAEARRGTGCSRPR